MLIVGGGLAGLSAAVGLGLHGVPSLVLESRDRLGGRASSFVDPETEETLDNCQHVGMGCCTNLQHFHETIGVARLLRIEPVLTFIGPEGGRSRLSAGPLPAPLHLAAAFARLPYLTWSEKWRIAAGLRALARWQSDGADVSESFADWLSRHRQTERVIERFWEVVLVSALSESLDRIDVGYARKVFVDGFLRHRRGWEVHVPTVSLDRLYGAPVVDWLRRHGGDVRCQAAVRRLAGDVQGITAVELRDGGQLSAGEVILAAPQYRVLELLPPDVAALPSLSLVDRIETSPITSLHLWFDRPLMDVPHAVLIGRLSQWVFSRGESAWPPSMAPASAEAVRGPSYYCQVVISASRPLRGRSQEEVRDQVLRELTDVWPAARDARLAHWRMVTEQRAVFSAQPGVDALRPRSRTEVPNLFLAGDWTATGWPSTLESAVRSGYLAAESLLRRRGIDALIMQPDLPTAWLSRLCLGLRSEPARSST